MNYANNEYIDMPRAHEAKGNRAQLLYGESYVLGQKKIF